RRARRRGHGRLAAAVRAASLRPGAAARMHGVPRFDATTPRLPVLPRMSEDLTPRDLAAVWFEDEDRFEGVELQGTANEGEIQARNVTIEDARITGSLGAAKPRDLHLHDAVIDGADLANVDLTDAHLNRLTITNARLTGANLTKATLHDVVLTGCRMDF